MKPWMARIHWTNPWQDRYFNEKEEAVEYMKEKGAADPESCVIFVGRDRPHTFQDTIEETEEVSRRRAEEEDGLTESDYDSFVYFMNEHGNPYRWCGWEEKRPLFKKAHPELIAAMENMENSIKICNAVYQAFKDERGWY